MGPGTKAETAAGQSGTERPANEIADAARLFEASSRICRAVVRCQSREELLQETVRVLTDTAKFAAAFVSWHDPATRELVPVASHGDDKGSIDRIRSFADEMPQIAGSAGAAFRRNAPSVCQDLQSGWSSLPWSEAARDSGWRGAASFPIHAGGTPQGTLSIYTSEPNTLAPDAIELLRQIALDVSLGVERLEADEQRNHAQAAFSTSEHHLKLAMDAAGLGTWDWDLATGEITWDGHYERMFGFDPGEFNGTYAEFESRVHPDDSARLNRSLEEALVSRGPFLQEFRVVWPDGSEHWVFARGVFHYTDRGQPHRMCGAAMDITDRKRVEAALRESEETLRQAVRVSDIGIFDHDHSTGSVYRSPQHRAIYGWGPHQKVTIEMDFGRVHPGDRDRLREAVERAHDPSGDGLFEVEHRLLMPDGSMRWLSTRAQTFFAGEGAARHPVRTVGAVRDITRQRQAQADQKKLAALVARSRDFIGIATLEGRVVYANHAAMALVGLQSIEEACEKTIFDFFPEEERDTAENNLFAGLLKEGYWSGESRLRHFRTGNLIDVEITAFQILDEDGAPLYFATVTRDITERSRGEAEKARLEEQLFQSRKMESIGRLAGGVAHDFNNLLTVINGYSGLLLSEKSTGSYETIVGQILNAGECAAGLTRQLLAFSRKQALQPRMVDLNRLVDEMRPMLERLVGEDVETTVRRRGNNGNVHADPNQLQQVILNLVANARDAMPEGGKLTIETSAVERDDQYAHSHPGAAAGSYVMLAISDTGVGMDDETRQRIFEPFFTTKGTAMGTGLGLSTVQGIVTQSGGHLEVSSEPGRGTTFRICLPALDDNAHSEIAESTPLRVAGGRESVLVVEDQAAVREFAVAALSAYGYQVFAAESAREALALCERGEHIDLVLTDVVMPNLSGQSLAASLRQARPGIKVLFMSGYTGSQVAHHGTLDEEDHFIEKPFSPEELAAKVRTVLGPAVKAARILIADDQDAVRGFLRLVLEERGYEVLEATNGKEAFRQALEQKVDLIAIDMVMLEQEDIDAIQALRQEAPGVGLIAMSGLYADKLMEMARALGADAVLSKPVSAETLLDTVTQALSLT